MQLDMARARPVGRGSEVSAVRAEERVLCERGPVAVAPPSPDCLRRASTAAAGVICSDARQFPTAAARCTGDWAEKETERLLWPSFLRTALTSLLGCGAPLCPCWADPDPDPRPRCTLSPKDGGLALLERLKDSSSALVRGVVSREPGAG